MHTSMHRITRIPVTELNPHFMCVLCGGYLVDATTIIECLHSFCRTCIMKYLESCQYCPICEVQVHKTRPYLNIRSDKTLQALVYKLVPDLFQNEMKRRRDFYNSQPAAAASTSSLNSSEERGEVYELKGVYTEDEQISMCLQHYDRLPPYKNGVQVKGQPQDTGSDRRHLLCPAAVTVHALKKFVRIKFDLNHTHEIEMFHSDEPLGDQFTLMDIAHVYGWRRKEPLKLFYFVYNKSDLQRKSATPVKKMTKGKSPAKSPVDIKVTEAKVVKTEVKVVRKRGRPKRKRPPEEESESPKIKKKRVRRKINELLAEQTIRERATEKPKPKESEGTPTNDKATCEKSVSNGNAFDTDNGKSTCKAAVIVDKPEIATSKAMHVTTKSESIVSKAVTVTTKTLTSSNKIVALTSKPVLMTSKVAMATSRSQSPSQRNAGAAPKSVSKAGGVTNKSKSLDKTSQDSVSKPTGVKRTAENKKTDKKLLQNDLPSMFSQSAGGLDKPGPGKGNKKTETKTVSADNQTKELVGKKVQLNSNENSVTATEKSREVGYKGLANKGQVSANKGPVLTNKGQMVANKGQMVANKGQALTNKGQVLANKGHAPGVVVNATNSQNSKYMPGAVRRSTDLPTPKSARPTNGVMLTNGAGKRTGNEAVPKPNKTANGESSVSGQVKRNSDASSRSQKNTESVNRRSTIENSAKSAKAALGGNTPVSILKRTDSAATEALNSRVNGGDNNIARTVKSLDMSVPGAARRASGDIRKLLDTKTAKRTDAKQTPNGPINGEKTQSKQQSRVSDSRQGKRGESKSSSGVGAGDKKRSNDGRPGKKKDAVALNQCSEVASRNVTNLDHGKVTGNKGNGHHDGMHMKNCVMNNNVKAAVLPPSGKRDSPVISELKQHRLSRSSSPSSNKNAEGRSDPRTALNGANGNSPPAALTLNGSSNGGSPSPPQRSPVNGALNGSSFHRRASKRTESIDKIADSLARKKARSLDGLPVAANKGNISSSSSPTLASPGSVVITHGTSFGATEICTPLRGSPVVSPGGSPEDNIPLALVASGRDRPLQLTTTNKFNGEVKDDLPLRVPQLVKMTT